VYCIYILPCIFLFKHYIFDELHHDAVGLNLIYLCLVRFYLSFVKIIVKNHCCQFDGTIPITSSFSQYTLLAILGCEYISYYMCYKAI